MADGQRRLRLSRRRQLVRLLDKIEGRLTDYQHELEGTPDEGEAEDASDWITTARMALGEATWLLDPDNDEAVNAIHQHQRRTTCG